MVRSWAMPNSMKPALRVIQGDKVDPLDAIDPVKVFEEMDVTECIEVFRRIRRQRSPVANSLLLSIAGTIPATEKT